MSNMRALMSLLKVLIDISWTIWPKFVPYIWSQLAKWLLIRFSKGLQYHSYVKLATSLQDKYWCHQPQKKTSSISGSNDLSLQAMNNFVLWLANWGLWGEIVVDWVGNFCGIEFRSEASWTDEGKDISLNK